MPADLDPLRCDVTLAAAVVGTRHDVERWSALKRDEVNGQSMKVSVEKAPAEAPSRACSASIFASQVCTKLVQQTGPHVEHQMYLFLRVLSMT